MTYIQGRPDDCSELLNSARHIADRYIRGEHCYPELFPLEMLKELSSLGHLLDAESLMQVWQFFPMRGLRDSVGQPVQPLFASLVAGLVDYARPNKLHVMYDRGFTLAEQLAQELPDVSISSSSCSRHYASIAHLVYKDSSVLRLSADPISHIQCQDPVADCIVCIPPPSGKNEEKPTEVSIHGVKYLARRHEVSIAHALCSLPKTGSLICVVQPWFFSPAEKNTGLRQVLNDIGFDIRCAVNLSLNTGGRREHFDDLFRGKYLVLLQGTTRPDASGAKKIFVGEFADTEERVQNLLTGYRQRISRELSNGQWLQNSKEFHGLSVLHARRRFKLLAEKDNLQSYSFGDLVHDIQRIRSNADRSNIEEGEDVIFIPYCDKQLVTQHKDEIRPRLGCYRLKLSGSASEVCSADYLTKFLNAQIGVEFRRSVSKERSIHLELSSELLMNSEIFLPSIEHQAAVIGALDDIESLRGKLTVMDELLWSRPSKVEEIRDDLERMQPKNWTEEWIESLPFPLASILWNYHAESSNAKYRVKRLMLFFEAFAQFLAVVHLSAWQKYPDSFEEDWRKVAALLEKQGLSLAMAKFGTWRLILDHFGKKTLNVLDGKDESINAFDLLGTHHEGVIKKLCSSEVRKILAEANSIRNNSLAHGGDIGESLEERLHKKLHNLLSRVMKEIGFMWNSYLMVDPGFFRMQNGTYRSSVRLVVGSRTPFRSKQIELQHALEDSKLHLWDPQERSALPLMPFIKLLESPRSEKNACYYYNRSEADGQRLVSYHLSDESERVEHFSDLATCLDDLMVNRRV